MAVYNEPKDFIDASIQSILSQSFSDFEFIIISDNPYCVELKEILCKYASLDDRIRIIENTENIGLARSLNKGIETASGEYIARMDADDISLSNRLKEELFYMENNKDIDVVSCNKIYIDEKGNEIGFGESLCLSVEKIRRILCYCNIVLHPGVLMRKSSVDRIGGYRNFPTSQDRDLWCRMISNGMKIGILDKRLLKYRINKNGVSESKAFKQALISLYIEKLHRCQLKYQKDYFSTENLNMFLKQHKAEDPIEIDKFNIARLLFENARFSFRKNKIYGMWLLIKSVRHPLICHRVLNLIRVYLIKLR